MIMTPLKVLSVELQGVKDGLGSQPVSPTQTSVGRWEENRSLCVSFVGPITPISSH